VRYAKFQIRPYDSGSLGLSWSGRGLPPGKTLVKGKDKSWTLELDNLPAFEEQAFAPPDGEIKARMDLFYSSHTYSDPNEFWKNIGKERSAMPENFRRICRTITGKVDCSLCRQTTTNIPVSCTLRV
jgi:hypothetical protein